MQDMQPTFSFNLRGAYNKIANLTQAQREKGIVACAAGNHLEGVAYAAAKLDVDAIVIAPVGTAQNISHSTKSKITIVEHGADFEASLVRCQGVRDVIQHRCKFLRCVTDVYHCRKKLSGSRRLRADRSCTRSTTRM